MIDDKETLTENTKFMINKIFNNYWTAIFNKKSNKLFVRLHAEHKYISLILW